MEMESMVLESLGDLILEAVISKLDAKNTVAVGCASRRLKAAASDENLWRIFCSRDFGLDSPRDPQGNPCPSFKVTYKIWFESFGMYPLPLVRRVNQFWSSIRTWLAVNFPEANDTLRKGASEEELRQVEETLGLKLPIATKLLYRFCDGQETVAHESTEHECVAPLGIIGGYEFYDYLVNVHLLPLTQIVEETTEFIKQAGSLFMSNHIIVAASYYSEKWFFLNCADGQLFVGTRNLLSDGEVMLMPCVPQALVKPSVDVNCDVPQDALLLWLEEHNRRLQSGTLRTRKLKTMRTLSLYPETPPACSIAVTNGVQVRASAVFVPELSDLSGKYFYAYSTRMSLLCGGCMLDGTYHSSCQLH